MKSIVVPTDDRPIRGYAHGTQARDVILISHGFKGFTDWGFFPWLAESLAQKGSTVLRFNFTHNGVDEIPDQFTRLDLFAKHTFGREIDEIKIMVSWVRQELNPQRVILLGHSRGGGTSLLAAAEEEVDAVVTLAGIDSVHRFDGQTIKQWKQEGVITVLNGRTGQEMPMNLEILEEVERNPERFDILARSRGLKIPCLHLHCQDDPAVEAQAADRLAQATRGLKKVFSNGGHTFGAAHPFAGSTPELESVLNEVSEFLFEGRIAN